MKLTNEIISLNEMPRADQIHRIKSNDFITIGDLHGNAVKLLYFLIREGVVQDMSEADYKRFNEIYKKSPNDLTKRDIETINQIINRLQINPNARQATLCFIGDMLCDRGQNDYFTLKLIEKLHNESVPFKILLSNHDLEFIMPYEKGKSFSEHGLAEQGISAENLQKLIDDGRVQRSEVIRIIEIAYLSNLNVLDCSGIKMDDFAVYSHAPIGIRQILILAKHLNVEPDMLRRFEEILKKYDKKNPLAFNDMTTLTAALHLTEEEIKLLKDIILNMNNAFREKVRRKEITDLCQINEKPQDDYRISDTKLPFAFLTWNRNNLIRRPSDIHFVYGHDSNVSGAYNLDNYLGKGLRYHDRGDYKVLHAVALRPRQEFHHEQKKSVEDLWRQNYSTYKANPRGIPNDLLGEFIEYLKRYATESNEARKDRDILMVALWENNYHYYMAQAHNPEILKDDMVNAVINYLFQRGNYYPEAERDYYFLREIQQKRAMYVPPSRPKDEKEMRREELAKEQAALNEMKRQQIDKEISVIDRNIDKVNDMIAVREELKKTDKFRARQHIDAIRELKEEKVRLSDEKIKKLEEKRALKASSGSGPSASGPSASGPSASGPSSPRRSASPRPASPQAHKHQNVYSAFKEYTVDQEIQINDDYEIRQRVQAALKEWQKKSGTQDFTIELEIDGIKVTGEPRAEADKIANAVAKKIDGFIQEAINAPRSSSSGKKRPK